MTTVDSLLNGAASTGDAEVEDKLYQPHNIEKIVACGGMEGITDSSPLS